VECAKPPGRVCQVHLYKREMDKHPVERHNVRQIIYLPCPLWTCSPATCLRQIRPTTDDTHWCCSPAFDDGLLLWSSLNGCIIHPYNFSLVLCCALEPLYILHTFVYSTICLSMAIVTCPYQTVPLYLQQRLGQLYTSGYTLSSFMPSPLADPSSYPSFNV